MFGRALTGKRVYGNGSYAPNRGQVSANGAQGYLKRSLQQNVRKQAFNGVEGSAVGSGRIGSDGLSDTRSGVAQAALARTGNSAVVNDGPKNQMGLNGGGGHMHQGGGRNGGGGKRVPHVIIRRNGMLKLPYDSQFNQEMYNDLDAFNTGVLSIQQQRQQVNSKYAMDMHNEQQNFMQQQNLDRADSSGAGMLYSSQYGTKVGNTAAEHLSNTDSLMMDRKNQLSDFRLQRRQLWEELNKSLGQSTLTRAQRAAQDAGHLGLGRIRHKKGKNR